MLKSKPGIKSLAPFERDKLFEYWKSCAPFKVGTAYFLRPYEV